MVRSAAEQDAGAAGDPAVDDLRQALDREVARRREAEQAVARSEAALRRAALLFELTDAANRTETLEGVYDLALDTVQRALGVRRAAVLIFDAQGVMRFVAWRDLSDAYRRAVDGHSPWKRGERGPRPLFVGDALADPAWAEYRATFQAEGIGALGFVPLVNGGQLLGKFMLYNDGPRVFTETEIQLAQAIASQVAQAVAQKQREVEVEKARAAAEGAARARAHLLAVVSHDLKNPLGVIFAAGEHLQRGEGAPGGGSVQRPVGLMLRAARQMDEIIHGLLDLAQSDAGRLDLASHPLEDMLRESTELLAPLAERRSVRLLLQPGTPLLVRCDRGRVLQVVSNLMGNAIRFTRPGTEVTLEASQAGGEARIAVSDEGPGIAPEHLPHIFEPYWRSASGGRSEVGLGLAIARGYVTAHGGHIWVDTKVGQGTTFYFTLPLAGGGPA